MPEINQVPFTIMFTCSRSWLSTLIRWWSGERITHVSLSYRFCDMDLVLEAGPHGVITHPRALAVSARDIVAEFHPPPGLRLQRAMEFLDTGYDYGGLFGMAWVYFCKRLGHAVTNPFGVRGRLLCSELVLRMDTDRVVETWRGLDPEATSPFRLYEACKKAGFLEA